MVCVSIKYLQVMNTNVSHCVLSCTILRLLYGKQLTEMAKVIPSDQHAFIHPNSTTLHYFSLVYDFN